MRNPIHTIGSSCIRGQPATSTARVVLWVHAALFTRSAMSTIGVHVDSLLDCRPPVADAACSMPQCVWPHRAACKRRIGLLELSQWAGKSVIVPSSVCRSTRCYLGTLKAFSLRIVFDVSRGFKASVAHDPREASLAIAPGRARRARAALRPD